MTDDAPSGDDPLLPEGRESSLDEHVTDARLLLDYAVRAGLTIEADVIRHIVKVGRLVNEKQTVDEEAEVDFMGSLADLSKLCRPVTPFSLNAITEQPVEKRSWLRRLLRLPPPAGKWSSAGNMLTFYRRTLFSLILVAIFVQGMAIFGNAAIRAHSEFEQVIDEYRQAIKIVTSPSQAVEATPFLDKLRPYLNAEEDRLDAYKTFWRINYLLFYKPFEHVAPRAFTYKSDPTSTDEQRDDPKFWPPDEDQTALAFTRLWISALSATLVPLIYGFLGANTYVLRRLSADIGSYALQRNARVTYGLRLSIGGISGLAIGLFVSPDFQSGLIVQLSPAALAFLAGYSSELLFSALDRFVNTFTQADQSRQGTGK